MSKRNDRENGMPKWWAVVAWITLLITAGFVVYNAIQ